MPLNRLLIVSLRMPQIALHERKHGADREQPGGKIQRHALAARLLGG